MSFRKSIFTILGCAFYLTSMGQAHNMAHIDDTLFGHFNEMIAADYSARYEVLAPKFKELLKATLSKKETMDIAFDSLSTRIKIVQSSDQKLKIFSWDERSGGSWHDMAAFAQFQTNDGQIKVRQLDSDREVELGAYTDVLIHQIHEIIIDQTMHYLTIGWGTHGSGHHHGLVQVFKIEQGQLIKRTDCFENREDFVVLAPRRDKINLAFHKDTNELTHNGFELDPEIGFYQATNAIVRWKLGDGIFKIE